MATKDTVDLTINFSGQVSGETCKFLFVEIIKLLLYQRDQIPLPIDQLKLLVQNPQQIKTERGFVPRRATKVPTDVSKTVQGKLKSKVVHAYEDYSLLFEHVSEVFDLTDVHEMIILLGPTIVSPREMYNIQRIQDLSCEHDLPKLPSKKCMGLLFKELITNSCLWSTKHISLTNAIILLKVSSSIKSLDFLEPMLTFNPQRSVYKRVIIRLNTECPECMSVYLLQNGDLTSEEAKVMTRPVSSNDGPNSLMWVRVNPMVKGLKDSAFKN